MLGVRYKMFMFIEEDRRVPAGKLALQSAHSAKIAFLIRNFGLFNEIMKQQARFLNPFSIPR